MMRMGEALAVDPAVINALSAFVRQSLVVSINISHASR